MENRFLNTIVIKVLIRWTYDEMNPIKNKGNNAQTCDFLITLLLFTGPVHVTSGSYLHLLHLYGRNHQVPLVSKSAIGGNVFTMEMRNLTGQGPTLPLPQRQ